MECTHESHLENEEVDCSILDSRGSGQYNDPCYGVSCPCEQGKMMRTYRCAKCGTEKTDLE